MHTNFDRVKWLTGVATGDGTYGRGEDVAGDVATVECGWFRHVLSLYAIESRMNEYNDCEGYDAASKVSVLVHHAWCASCFMIHGHGMVAGAAGGCWIHAGLMAFRFADTSVFAPENRIEESLNGSLYRYGIFP